MSSESRLQAASIYPGCAWRLGIEIVDASLDDFAVDATFYAQVRHSVDGPLLFELDTSEGQINRTGAKALEILISAANTANCVPGVAHIDIFRTDLESGLHLGFQLEIPVRAAITDPDRAVGDLSNIPSTRQGTTYSQYAPANVLQTGSDWELTLNFSSESSSIFPSEAVFHSNVISKNSGRVLAVLTTANGGVERVNGNTLKMTILGEDTSDWDETAVRLDVLRVDESDPVHLGFDLEIPVTRSVTRF